MQIYVQHEGQQLGPYTEAEIRTQLSARAIFPQDLVWWEGQAGWVELAKTPLVSNPVFGASSTATDSGVALPLSARAGQTSGLAIGSLVCGIAGLFVGLTFIVAIILGHMGLSEIKRNPGMRGRGMALAGLILGYLIPVLLVVVAVVSFFILLVLGQQVKGTFKTINAQLQQAEMESTNSTANPATNSSSNTNSAPDTSTNSAPTTTNAPPPSDGH